MLYYGRIVPFFSSGVLAMRVADLVAVFVAAFCPNTADIQALCSKAKGLRVDVYPFTPRHELSSL